ncbi:hypothetical protein Tco_0849906, partial [Tanacetum coccineum]
VINDRMTGALPSDTVKNPKPNVNPTSLVLSARSYSMEDPKSSYNPLKSVNAIKTCFKSTNDLLRDQQQIKTLTINKIETSKSKEPKKALEDKFKDLHLNLPVLEVLAYALMYNAILDKYFEILELGKNGSAFIQSEMTKKMKVPGLFILPCRLGDSKPFDTLADLGSCVNLIPLYLFKKLKIKLLEEIKNVPMEIRQGQEDVLYWITIARRKSYASRPNTDNIGAQPPYYLETYFKDTHVPGKWEMARDAELNPFKDVLVFRKMVEFLGAIPVDFKGNMLKFEDMVDKKMD